FPPLPLGLVPRRKRLQVGHGGQTGLGVARHGLAADENIHEGWLVGEGAIERAVQILGPFDALRVHPEGARHGGLIPGLQPPAARHPGDGPSPSLGRPRLLATTITSGARCRTAVSTSMALKPNDPSPVATTTCRPGQARPAAIPKGSPTPRQPSDPGSRYRP